MYAWYMKLKDGQVDEFYQEHEDNKISPLERGVEDFNKGESWSVDGYFEGYPEDPDPKGDGFPLVLKTDVVKVWREEVDPPIRIQKKSFKDIIGQ